MKGIKITQEIKDQNNIGQAVDSIYTVSTFPNAFWVTERVVGGYANRTDLHTADGWQEVIVPEYDSATQKLGTVLIEVDGDFTYEVIEKTESELRGEVLNNSLGQKSTMIQEMLEGQIIETAQALPDNEALDLQPLFPMWDDFPEEYRFEPPIKVQSFDGMELKLFKAIQPNDKRENTEPILFPAGWSKIEMSGGIEVWTQPIGGDGKYPYLNPDTELPYVVIHEGFYWNNNFTTGLNVWEPSIYGWTKGDAI